MSSHIGLAIKGLRFAAPLLNNDIIVILTHASPKLEALQNCHDFRAKVPTSTQGLLLSRYGTKPLVIDRAQDIFLAPREALRVLQMCGLEEDAFDKVAIPEGRMTINLGIASKVLGEEALIHQDLASHGGLTFKPRDSPDATDATVLIVEDDSANLTLAIQCMEMAGYRVLIARDGTQAVRIALAQRPDVILMDIRMPIMNGFEATHLIRRAETPSRIGIIAVTALATPAEEQFIRASGFDDYLAKPYTVKSLLELVAAQLTGR